MLSLRALRGKPPTVIPDAAIFPRWFRALCIAVLACLAACGTYEDKRIRELLHEKGFGARAQGDASRENYVGGRDRVQFLLDPAVLQQRNAERLGELLVAQPVGVDGTIFVPFIGPVLALGKTEAELAAYVRAQLRAVVRFDVPLQARIIESNKVYYAFGEVANKGRLPLETDMTLVDAVMVANWTPLANLGRVYLIRPDAEHPLVIDVNFREILTSGNTTANIQLRERDFLYIPPTFLGLIARLLERLLEPIGLVVRTAIGAAQAQASYQLLNGQGNANGFLFRF
jgi:protein involved in polysaccharide export with SLBB domain